MTENGLYIISDDFFARFPATIWSDNKSEARPHYYAFPDKSGLYWMIPVSSQTEKAKQRIEKYQATHPGKQYFREHIGIIAGKECCFKISNLFPVSERYVLRSYTVQGKPYVSETKSLNEALQRKAKTYLSMLSRGSLNSAVDVLAIKYMLLSDKT